MTYEIRYVKSAQKELKKLPKNVQVRILRAIVFLATNPRRGNVRPMVGSTAWRLRVGDYRVVYDIHDKEIVILILRIAHRKNAYKNASNL